MTKILNLSDVQFILFSIMSNSENKNSSSSLSSKCNIYNFPNSSWTVNRTYSLDKKLEQIQIKLTQYRKKRILNNFDAKQKKEIPFLKLLQKRYQQNTKNLIKNIQVDTRQQNNDNKENILPILKTNRNKTEIAQLLKDTAEQSKRRYEINYQSVSHAPVSLKSLKNKFHERSMPSKIFNINIIPEENQVQNTVLFVKPQKACIYPLIPNVSHSEKNQKKQAQLQLIIPKSVSSKKCRTISLRQTDYKKTYLSNNFEIKKPKIVQPSSNTENVKHRKPLKILTSNNKQQKLDNLQKNTENLSFSELILSLNRIEIQGITTSFFKHKYFIKKGNNDALVKRLMKKRGWVQTSEIDEASIFWSQKKQLQFISRMQNRTILQTKQKTIKKQPSETMKSLISPTQIINKPLKIQIINPLKISNHLTNNQVISNKKQLFINLANYYRSININPFTKIPETYHIDSVICTQWDSFIESHVLENRVWIIKPGQNTNRGTGIKVFKDQNLIKEFIREEKYKKSDMTFIVQEYLMPLLYYKRKFDIRCYMLVTVVGSRLRAYWYAEGYVRTSSFAFNLKNLSNKFIHLTNDAIQAKSEQYGKFQPNNKLSFNDLRNYISKQNPQIDFNLSIYPKMIEIASDIIKASYQNIHEPNKQLCYQVFGLDYMIDENYNTWLIQVNRNPCLETNCNLLERIVSEMIDNTLAIAVDPYFSPSLKNQRHMTDFCAKNKYTCIFETDQIWDQHPQKSINK